MELTTAELIRAEEILLTFLQRAEPRFNFAEAITEAMLIASCSTESDYFRAKRYGSEVALTRKQRRHFYGLWDSAKNHATVETEMREAGVLY